MEKKQESSKEQTWDAPKAQQREAVGQAESLMGLSGGAGCWQRVTGSRKGGSVLHSQTKGPKRLRRDFRVTSAQCRSCCRAGLLSEGNRKPWEVSKDFNPIVYLGLLLKEEISQPSEF